MQSGILPDNTVCWKYLKDCPWVPSRDNELNMDRYFKFIGFFLDPELRADLRGNFLLRYLLRIYNPRQARRWKRSRLVVLVFYYLLLTVMLMLLLKQVNNSFLFNLAALAPIALIVFLFGYVSSLRGVTEMMRNPIIQELKLTQVRMSEVTRMIFHKQKIVDVENLLLTFFYIIIFTVCLLMFVALRYQAAIWDSEISAIILSLLTITVISFGFLKIGTMMGMETGMLSGGREHCFLFVLEDLFLTLPLILFTFGMIMLISAIFCVIFIPLWLYLFYGVYFSDRSMRLEKVAPLLFAEENPVEFFPYRMRSSRFEELETKLQEMEAGKSEE